MQQALIRHTVGSVVALEKLVSKAPRATVLLPELADEDSPDGWQILGETPGRVLTSVRELLLRALHDLEHEIPEQYRGLPEVKEQCRKLEGLLNGEEGCWPFTVEIRDPPALDPSQIRQDAPAEVEGDAPPWVQAFLDGGDPREHAPSEFLDARPGNDVVQGSAEPVELGAARSLRRCVIAPGNGCTDIRDSNWYGWLAEKLMEERLFDEVVCRNFPDPYDAQRSIWLPFLLDELRVGPDTVLVGHSSGAEAAMRLAEEAVVGGLVLVAACHTDLGDEGERASGYYPPSGGPWRWDSIRKNTGWIVQFHSRDDHLVPVQEGRSVAQELKSEFVELNGHSHFFEPFEEIVEAIRGKLQRS